MLQSSGRSGVVAQSNKASFLCIGGTLSGLLMSVNWSASAEEGMAGILPACADVSGVIAFPKQFSSHATSEKSYLLFKPDFVPDTTEANHIASVLALHFIVSWHEFGLWNVVPGAKALIFIANIMMKNGASLAMTTGRCLSY